MHQCLSDAGCSALPGKSPYSARQIACSLQTLALRSASRLVVQSHCDLASAKELNSGGRWRTTRGERLHILQCRLLGRQHWDPIDAIHHLTIHRVLDPQRAVLIECGNALLRRPAAGAAGNPGMSPSADPRSPASGPRRTNSNCVSGRYERIWTPSARPLSATGHPDRDFPANSRLDLLPPPSIEEKLEMSLIAKRNCHLNH